MTERNLTPDELLRAVTDLLDTEAGVPAEDDSLIEWGLDSIQLMQVASQWRKRGVKVRFAQLAEQPTLGAWRALLAERLGTPAAPEPAAELPRVDPAEPFGLALMQHAYWIGRDDEATLGSVAAHLYVEFDGSDVDPERLSRAVRALTARHGMLRARFADDGTQRISPTFEGTPLVVNDLREEGTDKVADRLAEIRDANSHGRLDIAAGQVFEIQLSLLPDGNTRLHVDVDMLAADALSYRVLLSDLAKFYENPDTDLGVIDYSYPQYLAGHSVLRKESWQRARDWWAERIPELPGAPDLPQVPEEQRADPTRVMRKHHWLAPEDKARLTARAHRHGLTPATVVATAFAEVIGAWSGQPRFLLNVPMFDREDIHPEVGKLVGDFTSSVLVDVDVSDACSFTEHARRLQDRMHADAAHAEYSGVEVLRDLTRHQGEQVLAPVVFTSALNLGELFDDGVRRDFGAPSWIMSQGPQVLLDAQVTEVSDGLLINWDVREHAFPDGMIDAMFTAFHELITRLGATEDTWESTIGALLPAAQSEVREAVNATRAERSHRLLHDEFFRLASRTPEAPAVLWGQDGALSYAELADRALRVAAALRERGIGPGDTVAVTLPKGPDQLVAVLGVLAAGGAYVPIGVEQPAARRERIQRVAEFRVVLTDEPGAETSTIAGALTIAEALRDNEPLTEPVRVDEESAGYVLFTSGSTGEPKGVEVPHRAAMNTIDDLNERFGVTASDRCLGVSALDFDLSVYDIFGLLSAGGAVVLVNEDDRKDAARWARLVRRHGVTLVNCVPALLDMLLLAAGDDELASLRVVLLGGDWVGTDLPGRVAGVSPRCRFAGLGGTTETAIHSTVCEVERVPEHWRSVPYGTPLRNVRCRVVDARGRDCPDHVTGELWIGGDGVALGYRGDPGRTAAAFLSRDGVRWYRTGDLARYWPDGTIEFLGRRDHQVKLRGFRIELGEVEAVLAEHPQVRRAVAGVTGQSGQRLVAAVAADGVRGEEIGEWAASMLPAHMVPAQVVVLDQLPLTQNGKIDRRAVGEYWSAGEADTDFEPPRTALEKVIAGIWSEVLERERVGVHDRFFALGGDSVLATVIVARLREALDTPDISVRVLFTAPTVRAVAQRLGSAETSEGRLEQVAQIYLEIAEMSAAEVDSELTANG